MTGYGDIATRDVEASDRDRLREWRNRPQVREFSAGEREITVDEHSGWFDRVLAERTDQIQIVEVDGRPVGVVQLEGLDVAQGAAGWGCHLGETEAPPGLGAVLPLFGLGLGFGRFGLRRMHAQVLGHNRNMLGIHRRLGITREGVLRHHLVRADGSTVDVHQFGVLIDEWNDIAQRGSALLPKALRPSVADVLARLVED